MVVYLRVSSSNKFAGTYVYTWVERSTVIAMCLAHEHNTLLVARAQTNTALYGELHNNQEATDKTIQKFENT